MLPRFNLLIEWLCRWLLGKVRLSPRYTQSVRNLLGKGTLFYVIRDRSYLEAVATNYLLRENELPLVPFAGNLRLHRLAPLRILLGTARDSLRRLVRMAPDRPGYLQRLQRVVREGGGGLIFLKRGRHSTLQEFFEGNDPYAILIEEARHTRRPLYLLPQFAITEMQPSPTRPDVKTRLFGTAEEPSLLRRGWQVLLALRRATFECGTPLCVQEFIASHPGTADRLLVRKLKLALLQEFDAERRVYAGPKLRSRLDLRSEILRSPALYDFMIAQAGREGISKEQMLARADRILEKMASDPNVAVASALKRTLFWGFAKTYEAVEFDSDGLERVKQALKQGPVVLLPNHSSHADYLILSCLFNDSNLALPQIAAGENLTFWPMGTIFRKSGAFFIRRSFGGDRLYTHVFDTYLSYLLSEGYTIEFFLEGTRSRNGRLRPAQLGMLSRIVNGFAAGHAPRLTFMPVGIDYDRIFEERNYRRELEGGTKTKESTTSLVRLPKLLKEPRGRMYVHFGEAIDMAEFCRSSGLNVTIQNERREITRQLASEALARIQEARTITVTALVASALLADPFGPTRRPELYRRGELFCHLLLERAAHLGVRLGAEADASERARSLDHGLDLFLQAGIVGPSPCEGEEAFVVAPGHYLTLDYYRNALVNPLGGCALLALLVQAAAARGALSETGAEGLEGPYELLGSLLSRELVARRMDLAQARAALLESGCLSNGAGRLGVADGDALASVAWVVRPLVEAYNAMLLGALRLPEEGLEADRWRSHLRSHAQTLYASGELSCRELLTTPVIERASEMLAERGLLETVAGPSKKKKTRRVRVRRREALSELAERVRELLPVAVAAERPATTARQSVNSRHE